MESNENDHGKHGSDKKRTVLRILSRIAVSLSLIIVGVNLAQIGSKATFIILGFLGSIYIVLYEVFRLIKDQNSEDFTRKDIKNRKR